MVAVLAIACTVGVLRIALTVDLPVLYGSDEGWSAYHQVEAVNGLNPYPPHDSLMYNVYPPLAFYVFGVFGKISGDFIAAGRAFSLACFLLTAFGVGAAARAMGCRKHEALFASLVFATFLLFDQDYVGTNTPHCLGQAFSVAGLILCLRERRSGPMLFLAALLFTMAFAVKHNMVVAPLVVTAWLWTVDKRRAAVLAGSGIVLGLTGLIAFQALYGVPLLDQLASGRMWLLQSSLRSIGGRLPTAIAPIVASIALLRLVPEDRYVRFGLMYLAVAFGAVVYFLGGSGTSGNQLFDFELAIALGAGLCVSRASSLRDGRYGAAFAACFFIPAVVIIAFTAATGRYPRYWIDRSAPAVTATRADIAFLKEHKGPALCRQLALCFWAGKTDPADLWNVEQSVATGRRNGHELKDAITQRRYAVLQLCPAPNVLCSPSETRNRFSADIAATITANYRMVHANANGALWVPLAR